MDYKKDISFFCDISGTFSNVAKDKEKLKEFIDNVIKLKEKEKAEKLYFSFITSDKMQTLEQAIGTLGTCIKNTDIKLGRSFCEEGNIDTSGKETLDKEMVEEGRAMTMVNYVEQRDFKKVFCADDSKINNVILEHIWVAHGLDKDKLQIINPTDSKDLNECLENILDRENRKKCIKWKMFSFR